MNTSKRLIAILLATVMVLGGISFLFPLHGVADDNIASDKPVTLQAYDPAELASHSARQLVSGCPTGIRMAYGAPFTKVTLCMPTWGGTTTCLVLSLYKWDNDFDTSRKADPVATVYIENHRDNGHAALEFEEQPAGEYLLCIDDFWGGNLGVWQMSEAVSHAYTYESGVEKAASWEINVSFTKTPVEAFPEIASVMDAIDGNHTAPEEWTIPADSLLNTHKVMPDTWVFTDGLGRVSLTNAEVGDPREDKTVAMFYWTWHVDLATGEPFNVNDFMQQYPEAKNDYSYSKWPTSGVANFWNEPLWGYYRTDDEWVLRRQAELLANAGVDVIFTDNTNGNYTWKSSYTPLYETWSDAQTNGAVNVPKVSYLLPFGATDGSREQIEAIYLDIYRQDKYQNLWYYLDGKPMLMGYGSSFASKSTNLEKEIDNFFTFRPGQPGYAVKQTSASQWGWLSTYPQAVYYKSRLDEKKGNPEQVTVGVAVNHDYKSNSITAMNGTNVIGRSYSSTDPDRYAREGSEASKWGYNFAEQWNYALEVDPQVVFVTGWNEWTAGRHESWGGVENAFPDQFIDEYSRDIEPSKGELKDHYYYQLVNFVRQYKGANPIPTPSTNQTIDLNAGAEQWTTVEPYYAAYIGNTADRDADGYGSLHYTETSGRNDIIGAQIARDDTYIYGLVECAEDITPCTDKLWMNLYLDTDQTNQGWETFEYIVRGNKNGKMTLEKFTGEGYATEVVADVDYTLNGRYLTVKMVKSDLGLSGDDYTINFSWTDNVHDEGDYTTFSGDIMDFYTSGDVAPGGRFKYSYISTAENAGVAETETETDAETDTQPTTDAETTPESQPVTDTEVEMTGSETTATAEGGCQSALLSTVAPTAIPAMIGLFGIYKKRHQSNRKRKESEA